MSDDDYVVHSERHSDHTHMHVEVPHYGFWRTTFNRHALRANRYELIVAGIFCATGAVLSAAAAVQGDRPQVFAPLSTAIWFFGYGMMWVNMAHRSIRSFHGGYRRGMMVGAFVAGTNAPDEVATAMLAMTLDPWGMEPDEALTRLIAQHGADKAEDYANRQANE